MARTLEERLTGEDAEPWIPETPGEHIFGEVEEVGTREGDFGEYTVITLLTADGSVRSIAGFGTVLKGKLAELDPQPGDQIGVKFVGEKTGKNGKDYKDWTVVIQRASVMTPASDAGLATGDEFQEDE